MQVTKEGSDPCAPWLPAVPSKLRALPAGLASSRCACAGHRSLGKHLWCPWTDGIHSRACSGPWWLTGDSRKSAACKQRVTSLPWPSAANALCWKWKVLLALPKGWDGEGMIHLAKLIFVPSCSSLPPRTWPRVLLCALCCPGACSAHVPSPPDPLLLAGSGNAHVVPLQPLCEQGRETLTSNIRVLPREKVRTENALWEAGWGQGGM